MDIQTNPQKDDPYNLPSKALDDALNGNPNSQRLSSWQATGGGVDRRSGSDIISDATDRRIIIGAFPDGTYGIVVSKEGYDVVDLFS